MELITQLADQGVSYLLLALSIVGNIRLVFMLLSEKEKRVAEAEKVRDNILAPLTKMQTTLDGITVILQTIVKVKP